MTVPETPSPDMVAKRVRRPLASARPVNALRSKDTGNAVCLHA